MPLRIIYGKSGTGKSNFIYNEINEKIKQNEKNKIYIITPEQFSFTAEKKLMENKKSVINAEVITFNRMAYRVMNEIGGNIYNSLTKCGKSMLIYSILQKEKKNLNLLNKSDENIDLAMRTISEFKKNQVSIDELKKETENINDKTYRSNTAYGVLIEHYGICSGYSDAMALFLDKMNIINYKISNDQHVWNLVYLDGTWLHLDLTWDDPVSDKNITRDNYFLITTNTLKKLDDNVHYFSNDLFPETTSTKNN